MVISFEHGNEPSGSSVSEVHAASIFKLNFFTVKEFMQERVIRISCNF
jgi:hypothetical protein